MDEGAGKMNDYTNWTDPSMNRDTPPDQETAEELREDIEATRADMGQTIDELQYHLDPARLREEAKLAAHEATVGRAEDMMNTAEQRTKEAGTSLMDTLKQNPVPTALIAIGAGWLLMSSRDQDTHRASTHVDYIGTPPSTPRYQSDYSTTRTGSRVQGNAERMAVQASDRAQNVANQASQRAGQVADQAQYQMHQYAGQAQRVAGQAQGTIQGFMQNNPLAAAAIALGVGFAVGYAVPETQKEDQVLGEAHATAMDRVQSMAGDAIDKAMESDAVNQTVDDMAHKAVDKAKDAAHRATDQ